MLGGKRCLERKTFRIAITPDIACLCGNLFDDQR